MCDGWRPIEQLDRYRTSFVIPQRHALTRLKNHTEVLMLVALADIQLQQ